MWNYNAPRYSSSRATASRSRGALPHHRGDAPARELRLEFRQREGPRPALDRQGHAPPARERSEPQRGLLRAALERGAELDRAHSRIALRKELEVRNIAGRGPARAQAVEAHALELLPAPGVAPGAAAAPLEAPPGVAEHGRDRRLARRRALPRRDRDLDLLDLRQARAV